MISKKPRICVVGSLNMDMTCRTARLPHPGETLSGREFRLDFGGKGANQAVMAARLGAEVAMVGKVGQDVFGPQMLAKLKEEGIDTAFVTVDPTHASGSAMIIVDDNAQNCIVVIPGANGALTPAEVRAAESAIRKADVVVCQLEVPLETTADALRLARTVGVRTILNPAPAAPLSPEILGLTDLLVPNETELIVMMKGTGNQKSARAAAKFLGVPRLLVTFGSRGAVLVDGEVAENIPARAVAAVDTTGAGDAFIGTLAVFWAQGCPLREAAHRACAVASLTVTRPGAQAGFPSVGELQAILAEPLITGEPAAP